MKGARTSTADEGALEAIDRRALSLMRILAASRDDIDALEVDLSAVEPKAMRWLARIHPDNFVRRILLERSLVEVGEGTVVNPGFVLSDDYRPLLRIGERVAIGPNVQVICVSNPNNSRLCELAPDASSLCKVGAVTIGDDAWIGAGAVLLPGVRVGRAAVVGANSVVSRTVADFEVVSGAPLRHMRFLEALT